MIDGKPNIMTEFCIKCGVCGAQCPRIRFPEVVQKIE